MSAKAYHFIFFWILFLFIKHKIYLKNRVVGVCALYKPHQNTPQNQPFWRYFTKMLYFANFWRPIFPWPCNMYQKFYLFRYFGCFLMYFNCFQLIENLGFWGPNKALTAHSPFLYKYHRQEHLIKEVNIKMRYRALHSSENRRKMGGK